MRHRVDRLVLADHAPAQVVLHRQQLGPLALEHALDRNAGPARHHRGDVLGRHRLVDHLPAFRRLGRGQLLVQLRDAPVGQLAGLGPVAPALRLLQLEARALELLLELLRARELLLFRLPSGGQLGGLLLELAQLLLEPLQPLARRWILLLLQRLALDLQLDDAPVQLVELLGLGVDLHAQPGGRLVHQVDRLVRQEAIGDVAVRQGRGGDDRAIGDAHAVMDLVLLLDAAQDRDRVLDRRLAHEHRLEAPGERRVLLDVLAVLIQRGGADAVQLAARERGLEHVGRVHRALGPAGADQVVQLVDEQDDLAGRRGDLGEHRLEPLLELAAVFRAGDQRAEIERQQALLLQALRHVAVHDAQRQTLDDRGLADPGLADQHRVVLGPAGEHLDGAPDLLVAPDHRVELALARRCGQVTRILLERVVARLGRGAVRPAALAHRLDRCIQALRRDPGGAQRLGGGRVFGERQREQQPLDGDERIAGLLGQLLGLLEQPGQLGRHIDLAGAGAFHLGQLGQLGLDPGARLLGIAAGAGDQLGGLPLGVVEQDLQKVLRRQALMAAAQRQRLRVLQKAPRALGILLRFHGSYDAPLLCLHPCRDRAAPARPGGSPAWLRASTPAAPRSSRRAASP